MDNKFNTISFCRETYREYFDSIGKELVNEQRLFDDVATFIRIAVVNGYQMKIWDDGLTLVVEYNNKDESMSGVSLEWLGEDEYVEQIQSEGDESDNT